MSEAVALTDSTFDEMVGAEKPTLVEFGATWCSPCRAMEPILHELAGEHAEKMTVGTVDIDANPALRERFAIQSVPQLMLFAEGELLVRMSGAKGKSEIVSTVLPLVS